MNWCCIYFLPDYIADCRGHGSNDFSIRDLFIYKFCRNSVRGRDYEFYVVVVGSDIDCV